MKRLFCILLSTLMCVTAVFAAPVPAATVQSSQEIVEEQNYQEIDNAVLSQETDPIRSLFFEFENATTSNCSFQDVNNVSKENGVFTFTANKMDPRIIIPMSFDADDYESVKIRMKWEGVEREGTSPAAQLFYFGFDKDGNPVKMNETYSIKVYPGLSSDKEYKVLDFKLNNSNLKGMKITNLGFDPMNTNGTFSLDYIMVVPKNDRPNMEWHFNTDGYAEGWGFNGASQNVANGVFTGVTTANNNTFGTTVPMYKGSDYPIGYIRMMVDNLTVDANSLFYTNLCDADGNQIKGWSSPYPSKEDNQYNYISAGVSKSNNGLFKLYTYNFGVKAPYFDNYITKYYYNINKTPADINIDYVIFPHKEHFEWDFETVGYLGGLSISSGMILEDGHIKFHTTPESEYKGTSIHMNGINIDADKWAGAEIVMKHDVFNEGTSNRLQLYYSGTTESDEAFDYKEVSAAAARIPNDKRSTGEGSVLYYIDFQKLPNWSGSTIANLRIDPLKALGNYEVDYIRLVPMPEGVNEPLDEKDMTLTYKFEDEKAGTADGTITVDFGSQIVNSAESVVLSWASGNATDGYTALADYTAIKKIDGDEAAAGYTINKNMLIPAQATAVIATIKDCDKTFTLACDIPESKRRADRGEPLYAVGLISDIHVGGWGSESAPNVRLAAARTQLSELADFVVVNGDLTQWYGAFSGEEFKAYNYDGSKFGDNGVTSDEYLGIGTSQWTTLTDYFKGFTVPVYAVQGNHDIKDGSGWSDMLESEKYWRPFLEDWIEYSNNAENGSKYQNKVALSDDVNYYDTEINGTHFIFTAIPKTEAPTYAFGEEQLNWLDKTLYEKEESGKPIFVFGHVPLETELNGSYWDDQIRDREEAMAILAKHPTAIYVSGHTHYTLDIDYLSSIDGAQVTPSFIHDGGTTTINVPKDDANPEDTQEIEGSHGIVAKVYSDGIELWGRDFANKKWISRGYTYLTFKDKSDFENITLTKSISGNNFVITLNTDDEVNVSWILDGAEQENTGKSITVAQDFAGWVAVRISDDNGNYRSNSFDSLADIDFEDIVTPEGSVSLRIGSDDSTTGMRFISSISNDNRSVVNEYGYIVTRKTFLDRFGGELTFDFKTDDGIKLYVYGMNHVKKSDGTIDLDKVFERTTDGIKFSGVVTGIDTNDPMQVCEVMVARPYAKLTVNGEEIYVYGEAESCSLKEIATYIRNKEDAFYNANKQFIDKLADMNK